MFLHEGTCKDAHCPQTAELTECGQTPRPAPEMGISDFSVYPKRKQGMRDFFSPSPASSPNNSHCEVVVKPHFVIF